VAFRAGDVKAAAWTEEVERILPMQDLLAAPAAPPHVLGLLRYQGRVLVVVDVTRRLFVEGGTSSKALYLLAGTFGGIPAALAVTDVEGILPAESFDAPEPSALPVSMRGLLAGAVRAGGEERVLIDLTRFLEGEEATVAAALPPD
jgi:chemotaxis signal transduction protein